MFQLRKTMLLAFSQQPVAVYLDCEWEIENAFEERQKVRQASSHG